MINLHEHLGLVYQVYGAAFLILGTVALTLPSNNRHLPFARHLWLLGLFGILHGLQEFVEWQRWQEDGRLLSVIGITLMVSSFLFLFEFARRCMVGSGHEHLASPVRYYLTVTALSALSVWQADNPVYGIELAARYLLGAPGAILVGVILLQQRQRLQQATDPTTHTAAWTTAAAIAFITYGLSSLFVKSPDAGLPDWIPNQNDFSAMLPAIPVQVPRALCAVIATCALAIITRSASQRSLGDLDTLLETISGFVYRCRNDRQWTMIYMAGNVRDSTGYDIADFMENGSMTVDKLVHPEDREPVWREVQAALERGESYELSYRLITRDGRIRRIQEHGGGHYDPNGRLQFLQGHVSDASELVETKQRLERAEQQAKLGHWEFDPATGTGHWSRQMYRLLDRAPELGVPETQDYLELLHPDDRGLVLDALQAMEQGGPPETASFRSNPESGPVRWLRPTWHCIRDLNDEPVRYSGTLQDVTEIQRNLEALDEARIEQERLLHIARKEQSRMAALLSGMSIGILFEDREGRVEYVNPAFQRMWAIDENLDLQGRETSQVLEFSTHRFARPDHASRHVLQVLDTHEISERFELDLYDGRILTQLSYPVTEEDGRLLGRLWIYEDVTQERQTAQQLVYLAEHDPLTGLYNRHRFQEQLEWLIHSAKRHHKRFAVLYFDLDDFKYVNDSYGHRAGDTVLVRTAGEIASLVRSGEMFARLGGDEFAILTEVSDSSEPQALADRICHTVGTLPFRFRGSNFRLTTSIGITIYPDHGDNAENLIAHADAAMYQAKNAGKNTWSVYDANRDLSDTMMARMTWASRIEQALRDELLVLHFQGVYHIHDRSLSHLEALVRMRDAADPDRLIMPGQFIPVSEKSGHILEIDRWVLSQAVQVLASNPQLKALAVNVSGRSFDEPALSRYIEELLHSHAVAPERLLIELTETAAVAEMQDAQRFIEDMQRIGCRVCLDDFGTGFSTFAYLKYLAVATLKIDGLFIRDLPDQRDNQAFVKAMIDVARGLDKSTVAEFVENERTLQMLGHMGVDLAQGFHLDRPVAEHPALRSPDGGVSPTPPSSAG